MPVDRAAELALHKEAAELRLRVETLTSRFANSMRIANSVMEELEQKNTEIRALRRQLHEVTHAG